MSSWRTVRSSRVTSRSATTRRSAPSTPSISSAGSGPTRSWAPIRRAGRTCCPSAGPRETRIPRRTASTSIGLKRAGFSDERVEALQKAYRFLRQSKLNTSQALERIAEELPGQPDVEELVHVHPDERAGLHQVRLPPDERRPPGASGGGRRRPPRAPARPHRGAHRPASPSSASTTGTRSAPTTSRAEGSRDVLASRGGGRVAGGGRRRRDADGEPRRDGAVLPRARSRRARREADDRVRSRTPTRSWRWRGRRGRILEVGHVERYNPAVEAALSSRRRADLHRGAPARRPPPSGASTSTWSSTS